MNLQVATVACILVLANFHTRVLGLINGRDALPGEFPHQVNIVSNFTHLTSVDHLCGGAILSKDWVITAAYCATLMNGKLMTPNFTVRTGHDSRHYEQSSMIKSTYIHEKFKYSPLHSSYDIALIKVATPFIFNDLVKPISLPAKGNLPVEYQVTLSSWGAITRFGEFPKYPQVLQAIDAPIIDQKVCDKEIKNIYLNYNVYLKNTIDDTKICTGPVNGLTDCIVSNEGDIGSPLAFKKNDGNLSIIGILTYYDHAFDKPPTVYTRVYQFIDWINVVMTKY